MAKKKKTEDVLPEQIPLEEAIETKTSSEMPTEVSEEKTDAPVETKKKKEKKVSRKQKKADKKKAAAENAAIKEDKKVEKDSEKKAEKETAATTEEIPAPKKKKQNKQSSKKREAAKEEEKPKENTVVKKEESSEAEESIKDVQADEKPLEETYSPKKKKQSKQSSKKREEAKEEEKPKENTEVKVQESSEAEEPIKDVQADEKPVQDTATSKKKPQNKKSSKKREESKTEEKPVEKPDTNAEEPQEVEQPVEEILADEKTVEEMPLPKKKKQRGKSSKKKTEDLKPDNQSVEELLTASVDSEKTTALNEAFAEIENQLKELEKVADGSAVKGEKKRSRKKEAKTDGTSLEKPLVEEAPKEETPKEETPKDKKGFIKEFTIQLNKQAIKEETLGEPLADEFYIKHDDTHKFNIPDKISDENTEELTLFGDSSEDSDSSKDLAKSLPSLGKLQDIKGEEIEDFIEPLKYFGDESKSDPALEEDIGARPADAGIKPLPRFLAHFVPVQGDGIAEIIRKGFIVICVVLLFVSMGSLIDSTRKEDMKSDESGKNSLNSYSDKFAINETASDLPEGVLEKYHSLYNVNSDMVGWLTLPGTPIDMPVVQYVDNQFYETTDFNGNDLVGLVAYADSSSSMKILGRKTILYVAAGENYGEISGLDVYKTFDTDSHKKESFTLSFGTLYDDYEWGIIAGILASDVDTTLAKLSVEDFSEFSRYLLDETIYPSSLVNIKSGDKTLMLCIPYIADETVDADSDGHLILIAKLLNRQSDD